MKTFEQYLYLLKRNGLSHHVHQQTCVEWCLKVERSGITLSDGSLVKSGIVADEMGLGKTLQMLAVLIEQLPAKTRTLIVLPRALLEQWRATIVNLLGHHPTTVHSGKGDPAEGNIILTTYGTLGSQFVRAKQGSLLAHHWDRVIFDEAHHLRNPKTRAHKAAAALSADHKWMLSGTPIQNSLADVKSLCRLIGVPASLMRGEEALVDVLSKVVIRRTKDDVGMELPALGRTVITVPWETEQERSLAEDIHAWLSFSGVLTREDLGEAVSPHHFAILQQARQCCIDSRLLAKTIKSLRESGVVTTAVDVATQVSGRSKMNAVIRTVLGRPRSSKKLIFCHYRKEIDTLEKELSSEGLTVGTFDGRISQANRKALLSNTRIDVLVLQIKTGCEGLNLQQFTEVYFVTPHWNPAVEDQAVARCHRQGQTERVDVFMFRMEAFDEERATRTMDIHINHVQLQKRLTMCLLEQNAAGDLGAPLDDDCAICISTQHKHDHIKLPCGHTFHATCLANWILRSPTCPLCRQ